MTDEAADDRALPLGGLWTRREHVTPAMSVIHEIEVTQHDDEPGKIYEVHEHLFERLLTEAGYARTEPSTTNSPDTTQETS
jgi:hypothetical protein